MSQINLGRMRWRWGAMEQQEYRPSPQSDIYLGYMLGMKFDDKIERCVVPIDEICSVVFRAQTFVGVAMQPSPPGAGNPILVATCGAYAFERLVELDYPEDALVAPLDAVTVIPTDNPHHAIGRVRGTSRDCGENLVIVSIERTPANVL